MRLKDKLAVITAAASGMGRPGVELFAREGATVAAVDINAAALKTVVGDVNAKEGNKGGKVIPIVSDLSTVYGVRKSVDEAAATLGGIDVMWAHAGTPGPAAVEGLDPAEYEKAMALNVTSAVFAAGEVVQAPRRRLAGFHGLGVRPGGLDVQSGLFGRKICRRRLDQIAGATVRGGSRAGQRRLPRADRYADAAWLHRAQRRQGTNGRESEEADGRRAARPHRAAGGSRPRRPVARVGRRFLCHRHHPARGWRLPRAIIPRSPDSLEYRTREYGRAPNQA